ncbi:MAG: [FeFe] hydrogenase H-cluster maturation GTPase HydF [Clostridiales bacterium]|nr:[FeFe] hydrogenase H-cluster maturation GTPase HydF [Clostridiales bacterium]
MGMNDTPLAERVHIGFFGRRNAGKSSVVNAVTGQELAVVSDKKGTTTDPVCKTMELLPLGPVVIIDTPGYDDRGSLGEQRVRKTRQVLNKTDIAVLVVDASAGKGTCEEELLQLFREKEIPCLTVYNKSDLLEEIPGAGAGEIYVSALKGQKIYELKEKIGGLAPKADRSVRLAADLIDPGDLVVLVTPTDSAAPKGRLILPQQQTIRDLIDADAAVVVVRENGYAQALQTLGRKPSLVVTDSQVFGRVSKETPEEIPLTSFSILMARYKGILHMAVTGAAAMDRLQDKDRILIAEGCTHHRQCEDIGTVKLPRWLREYTGKELSFAFCSGTEFPEDLSAYKLILHCGGCMLTEREVRWRMKCAGDQGVPVTNYGVAIAHIHGILKRSISMFPQLLAEFDDRKKGII